jgi:hypothetical protein
MQNETPLKQELQQEPVSQTPIPNEQVEQSVTQGSELKAQSPELQAQGPKPKAQSSKGLLVVVAIFVLLLLIGGGVGGYLLWKNSKDKDSSTDTEVEQTEEDESTTTTTTTETTEDSTDSTEDETEEVDPYEGWNYKELEDCKLSFYYPSNLYFFNSSDEYICGEIATTAELPATEGSNLPLYITFGSFSWSDYDTPTDHYENLSSYPSQTIQTNTKKIDGEDCFYVIHTDEYGDTYYWIYFESGNEYYYVMWTGTELDNYQQTIDKILESVSME